MKARAPIPPVLGVLFSVVLHATATFVAMRVVIDSGRRDHASNDSEMEIEFLTLLQTEREGGEPLSEVPSFAGVVQPPAERPPDVEIRTPPHSDEAAVDLPTSNSTAGSSEKVTHESLFLGNPYDRMRLTLPQDSLPARDSTHTLMPPLSPGEDFPPSEWGGDRLELDLYTRNTGSGRMIPLTDILRQAARLVFKDEKGERAIRMDFIPTDDQLESLNVIWDRGSATDQEIYAELDTSLRTTSADLNRALVRLTNRGLLMREIISPRNEFTLMTPLGSRAVEMSATNRRNRVYRYKPRIAREEMLIYLQAVLTQVRSRETSPDSSRIAGKLQDKILRIVKPETE